ncbi:YdcF family protein [Glycocaulis abyssi]|uniref:YdcF family protein n=1 Tax=Glycocaulis abyssi TaxID=1433403 RepID=A0ABV9NG92_9PROT
MKAAFSVIRFAAFALVIAAVVGFALFVRAGLSHVHDAPASGDAIVALTGGEGRVATGVSILAQGHGARLLISGGNPEVTMDAIRAAAGAPPELFDCCVDIGVEAANTVGNAEETARWASTHGYQRLVIITSDFHMPRALLELKAAMPERDLIPYGVATPPPWANTRAARRWLQEYLKFSAVYARETVRAPLGGTA